MSESDRRPLPRQQRAIATRGELLKAALRAFAAKGHDGVSLAQDILEPAGVSVGSFYHQFRDKTDLLIAVLDEFDWSRRRTIAFAAEQGGETSLEESVRRGFAELFDDLDQNELAWRVLFNSRRSAEPRIEAAVERARSEWQSQNEGQLRSLAGVPAESVTSLATLLVAFGDGLGTVYLDWSPADRKRHRAVLCDAAVSFALGGIGEFSAESATVG